MVHLRSTAGYEWVQLAKLEATSLLSERETVCVCERARERERESVCVCIVGLAVACLH